MKILTISIEALKYYRKEARQAADLEKELLELKLSAMANNSEFLRYMDAEKRKAVYKYGSFIMVIDKKHNRIETVCWRNDLHKGYRVPKEIQMNLKADYRTLGLTSSGNNYMK